MRRNINASNVDGKWANELRVAAAKRVDGALGSLQGYLIMVEAAFSKGLIERSSCFCRSPSVRAIALYRAKLNGMFPNSTITFA